MNSDLTRVEALSYGILQHNTVCEDMWWPMEIRMKTIGYLHRLYVDSYLLQIFILSHSRWRSNPARSKWQPALVQDF